MLSVEDSSGKSQKPLYPKLENSPKNYVKSPFLILRLLLSYTSTQVVSGVSAKESFFLSGESAEEIWFW